ncbi:hypothetical protein CLV28_1067 [Sediminihabitans luteus]|uniref:Probable membrane transporter protein n=1 Tax=Sediminihabitans luteus TaxID=1138585 RepID=A0A2M9D0W1_9CELL|nr:sulfite exporter TauE/SafE family protein [Sediminihabitans luteus]PJJ77841.1 hypothetical protein CLV28_1067 [Sediminihabitans luteus]GII99801.1 hypothetical protein Slu03_21790 [Sediminihabitans luteus]
MTPSILALAAATLVVAVAALAQSATGSGFSVIAAPLLLVIDPVLVPGPLLLLTLVVMASVVWRERAGLRHVDLGWAAVGAVPAAIGATWLVPVLDERTTALVLGLFVTVSVVAGLAGWSVRQNRATLTVSGALGGALGTIAATPGPPVIVVYQQPDVTRYRANLSAFFFVTSAVSFVSLLASGGTGAHDAVTAAALLPGLALGIVAAQVLVPRMPARWVRPGALALCLVSGVSLLVSAATA